MFIDVGETEKSRVMNNLSRDMKQASSLRISAMLLTLAPSGMFATSTTSAHQSLIDSLFASLFRFSTVPVAIIPNVCKTSTSTLTSLGRFLIQQLEP